MVDDADDAVSGVLYCSAPNGDAIAFIADVDA